MQSLGQWSDSFCSCLADKKMGLLSFLCSWYVVFITMQKIGTVSTVCGPLTKERFGFALVIFVLFWALLRSVTSSFVGHLGLCPVILLYLAVLRGIRDKIGVKETDFVTCLKFMFLPCFVAQVERHVRRYQGFWQEGRTF